MAPQPAKSPGNGVTRGPSDLVSDCALLALFGRMESGALAPLRQLIIK
jgi:hypothetical protein